MKKINITDLKNKYNYLGISDDEFNNLISIALDNVLENNIEDYINNLIKNIINNKLDNIPKFLKNISRNVLLSNFINLNLSLYNNFESNLIEIRKLYTFYQMIESDEEIIKINSELLMINTTFRRIVENILLNFNESIIEDKYLTLIQTAYFSEKNILNYNYYNNEINDYINDLRRIPVLSYEEEKILFIKAKNGDMSARKKILESNLRLVIAIAIHYSGCGELNDLIQSGNIGLIRAYNKFDIKKGFKFSTYATFWVRKEINDFIEINRNIRIPHNNYSMFVKVEKAKKELEQKGINVCSENISSLTGIPSNKIEQILKLSLSTLSLDVPLIDNDESSLIDLIPGSDNTEDYVIDKLNTSEFHQILRDIVDDGIVSRRDITILLYHNGFFNDRIYKYDEIGKLYNISKQRVDQICKKAIKAIKNSKYIDLLKTYYSSDKVKRKV